MDLVIEFETTRLVDFTKKLFNRIMSDQSNFIPIGTGAFYTHPYIKIEGEELEELRKEFPFLTGIVNVAWGTPTHGCGPHLDNHDGFGYANINVLVESGGPDHYTRYFEMADGSKYDPEKDGYMFTQDMSLLKEIYRFTVKEFTPTYFRATDVLHDIINDNVNRRAIVCYVIDKEYTDAKVKQWADDNNIKYEVKFTYE